MISVADFVSGFVNAVASNNGVAPRKNPAGDQTFTSGQIAGDAINAPAESRATKEGGARTEPTLPDKTVVNEDGVQIEHDHSSGDHGPAHLHVKGEGPETRIGQNGKPLAGDPELSSTQRSVVSNNKSTIRKAVDAIQRWFSFNSM